MIIIIIISVFIIFITAPQLWRYECSFQHHNWHCRKTDHRKSS